MATSGLSVQCKDVEMILQCFICFETFKRPQTLPCLHTFCGGCLETAVPVIQHEGHPCISCPLCHKFHRSGEYINSFLVKQFMELYSKCTEQVAHCYCCDGKEVQWRCLDCKLNMCAPCQYVHSKTPTSQLHKYQSFTTEANLTLDEILYCEHHKGHRIELYCVECESLICMMCRATSHSNHKCETVDQVNKRLTKKVEDILKSVIKDLEECKEQDKFFGYHHDIIQREFELVKAKYREKKRQVIAAIEKKEQEALHRLENSAKRNCERIQAVCNQNKDQSQVRRRLIDTSTTAMNSAKGCSLLNLLSRDLMQKLAEEEQKPVNNVSVEVAMPIFNGNMAVTEDIIFVNPSRFSNHAISFQPQTLGARSFNVKFADVMSTVDKKKVEVKLQGRPFRLNFVQNSIWIPSNKEGAGDYQVFNICNQTNTCKSHDTLKVVNAFCQSSNNNIIAACNNGLYSLTTNGQVEYKITDGVFTDVCTGGESLVAVERNECQVQVYRLTNKKWSNQTEFTVKDPDKTLKSIHVNHNSVYVCYNWTDKIYKYSLQGEYLEEYGAAQTHALCEFYGPYLSGTDCQGSLIVCDSCNHCIQVRSSQGEWQQYKLEGITRVRDVVVVKGRLFVLWGKSGNMKLAVYETNLFK